MDFFIGGRFEHSKAAVLIEEEMTVIWCGDSTEESGEFLRCIYSFAAVLE